jgi:Co/Zn/Cd efflux system component
MIALTSGFFIIEITVGYVTNSMALVADSFHMLSDVASIIIAFLSVKVSCGCISSNIMVHKELSVLYFQMSPKKWSKNTFGWARAEVLGALVNAVFLVALCFSILIESLKRCVLILLKCCCPAFIFFFLIGFWK